MSFYSFGSLTVTIYGINLKWLIYTWVNTHTHIGDGVSVIRRHGSGILREHNGAISI